MNEDTIITLNNQKSYLIVDQLTIEGTEYYYLCSTTKPVEIQIALHEDNKVTILTEPEITNYIYHQFVNHMSKQLGITEE